MSRTYIYSPFTLLLCLMASAAGALAAPQRNFPALVETDHDAFTYTMQKKTFRDFAVRFRLPPDRQDRAFRARIVFAWDDEDNHDFLDLTRDRMWLGSTEAGLERRIGPEPRTYDPSRELVLRRWQGKTTVFSGGTFLIEARGADACDNKAVGYGVSDSEMALARFRPQRLERIYFADDFMSAEQDASSWETLCGTWQIATIKNPLRSANAFHFVGRAEGVAAIATAGYPFWHDYTAEAACRPSGTGSVGLLVYHSRDGHYRFDWSSGPEGKKRVVRVKDEETIVLSEEAGGYVPGQWYRLRAEVSGRRLRCFVDGHVVADVYDAGLPAGSIGLRVEGDQECSFDDVTVQSARSFRGDFRDDALVDWQQFGGLWRVTDTAGLVGVGDPGGPGTAKVLVADRSWDSHDVSAIVGLPTAKAAGLCFGYLDEGNHYRFEIIRDSGDRVALTRVVDGQVEVVAQAGLPAGRGADGPARLRVVAEENVVRAYVNGVEVLPPTWDTDLSVGCLGLCVRGGEAVFADFAAVPLEPFDRAVVGASRTFSHEKSMANWASVEGEWLAAREEGDDNKTKTFWHRADVPGDGGIGVELSPHDRSADQPWQVALLYNVDAVAPGSGYTALLSGGAASGSPRLELRRDGERLADGVFPAVPHARTFRLQRVGRVVSVWLDDRPALHVCDAALPPTGLRAGWRADGIDVEHDRVNVFSRNVGLDDFRKSPADWRSAAGLWDVTVRWECDPRWSFFSGRGGMFAASEQKLAAIWHKRSLPGNFTVEFTVGQKMAREFGSYADYTRDFNVTVCGDGRDLTSGYTCTFGGWDNTKTAILRGRAVVAETEGVLIPRSDSMHRQWFNIKVRRRGARLSFVVDDEIALDYDDPEPLPGARVALWTYNNGFMISRFRVSTEEPGPMELPGTAQGAACRSFYDPE